MGQSIHYKRTINCGWASTYLRVNLPKSFGDANYTFAPEFDFNAGNWWCSYKDATYFDIMWENYSWYNNVTIEIYHESGDGG